MTTARKKKKATNETARTTAEWVSLVISLVLIAGVLGVVIALWVRETGAPVRFRVERGAVRNEGERFYLPLTVTNDGDAAGTQVTVEGRLGGNGGDTNSAATTFDFIPAHSSVECVLLFPRDPSAAEVSVTSCQQP